MSTDLPPIALFGYDSSPFTQKVRLTLRLLQLPYTFVVVPSMMPRPILVDNFNLTYRKIPVLAIGKELIVDTSLIVEWLHADPRLKSYRDGKGRADAMNAGMGYEVHHDAKGRVLARLLSSHYTDRPLFRVTTGLIPGVVWRTSFGADRSALIGHELDPDKLERKVPTNLAALDTFLSILEPLFAGQADEPIWMLGGNQPSAADASLYYQLDWGERISRGEGIKNLTAGGTVDGIGEGMLEVFNERRYPGVWVWFKRFRGYVDGLPDVETRVEQGDTEGVDEVMERIKGSERNELVPMLPTPNDALESLKERTGLRVGSKVSIAPDDTGRSDPTVGNLVGISPEEVAIVPDSPEAVGKQGKKARVEGVRLHFPRVGFVVVPVNQSKL